MSNKTEILSFDDALNEHKRLLTESLVNFDEGQRVRKIMLDIDSNSANYEYYFQSGQQSKQGEVDKLQTEIAELQKKYNAMYNAFVVADDCRKEWHRCYVGIRQREDDLQKRIDDALIELEEAYRKGIIEKPRCIVDSIKILKGEETK